MKLLQAAPNESFLRESQTCGSEFDRWVLLKFKVIVEGQLLAMLETMIPFKTPLRLIKDTHVCERIRLYIGAPCFQKIKNYMVQNDYIANGVVGQQ